jgi:hypothetical protein
MDSCSVHVTLRVCAALEAAVLPTFGPVRPAPSPPRCLSPPPEPGHRHAGKWALTVPLSIGGARPADSHRRHAADSHQQRQRDPAAAVRGARCGCVRTGRRAGPPAAAATSSPWGLESRPKAAARLVIEASAGWLSPSSCGLLGGDALPHPPV